jgi:hypothetical protein
MVRRMPIVASASKEWKNYFGLFVAQRHSNVAAITGHQSNVDCANHVLMRECKAAGTDRDEIHDGRNSSLRPNARHRVSNSLSLIRRKSSCIHFVGLSRAGRFFRVRSMTGQDPTRCRRSCAVLDRRATVHNRPRVEKLPLLLSPALCWSKSPETFREHSSVHRTFGCLHRSGFPTDVHVRVRLTER